LDVSKFSEKTSILRVLFWSGAEQRPFFPGRENLSTGVSIGHQLSIVWNVRDAKRISTMNFRGRQILELVLDLRPKPQGLEVRV